MRLSLPRRIFAVHFLFMLALGALGVFLVNKTFEQYEQEWDRRLETMAPEQLFTPLANEVARSLLLRLEQGQAEKREQIKRSVGVGLDKILPAIPSIERLLILGPELEIEYATDDLAPGSLLIGEEFLPALESEEPVRRRVQLLSGDEVVEVVLPVIAGGEPDAPENERRRIGTVVMHFRPNLELAQRLASIREGGHEEVPVTEPGGDVQSSEAEKMLAPWVLEVARSLLLELVKEDLEGREEFQVSVSEGLNKLIDTLPMETLIIVDRDNRIQYVNQPELIDLTYTRAEHTDLFASRTVDRKYIDLPSGERGIQIMLPVWEPAADGDNQEKPRRLGSLLVHYRRDSELTERVPQLSPPHVGLQSYIEPLILFFVAVVGVGIFLSLLTAWPVRRMDRALADYKARGFKGGLDPKKVGLPSDLASTVQTINELGGKLESLDAQGREREAMLETLSQTLEDGMIAISPGGEPAAWNPAAMRILTGSVPEHLDDDFKERTEEPDEESEATTAEKLQKAAEGASLKKALARNSDLHLTIKRDDIRTRELEIRHEDDGTVVARVTQVPIALDSDQTGTLLLVRDLAALRKVEAHLLDAGRFAVLAHLAASLAHEIRNPLHAIQLNASVVEQYATRLRTGPDSQAVIESLTVVRAEATRLSDLLNNYLGMVRPSDQPGPVNLCDVSRRVIQLVAFAARRSHVELKLEGDESPPMVHGVANRLQQAVLNLVLNAIQAMPTGGTVTLRVDSFAENVRLAVSDTGPGLRQDLADQLFDTRVTTKPEGSGLGLPLVRMIVESHGGGVWYRSTPGQGASFMMAFPAMKERVAETADLFS